MKRRGFLQGLFAAAVAIFAKLHKASPPADLLLVQPPKLDSSLFTMLRELEAQAERASGANEQLVFKISQYVPVIYSCGHGGYELSPSCSDPASLLRKTFIETQHPPFLAFTSCLACEVNQIAQREVILPMPQEEIARIAGRKQA